MSENQEVKKKSNKISRFLYLLLGSLIILFLILYIALQIPAVQNWVADMVANRLSHDLDTHVSVDRVDIDFTNHLILDGLYIEDKQQDTLVYVGHFRTDLARSVLTFFSKKVYIDEANLKDAIIHIKTLKGESNSNLDQIFGSKQTVATQKEESSPWMLKLSKFYGQNILIDQLNENKGRFDQLVLKQGAVIINPNSALGILEVKNIDLQSPEIIMESWVVESVDIDNQSTENKPTVPDGAQVDDIAEDSTQNILTIRDFKVRDGSFIRRDRFVSSKNSVNGDVLFDPSNMSIEDIFVDIENINYVNGEISLVPKLIKGDSKSGFSLEEFRADKLEVLNKKIKLSNLYLKTDRSLIKKNIELKYKDFSDLGNFEDKVYLNVDLDNSKIALDEIIHFVPSLKKNGFINQNRDLVASIDGIINGRVNNLNIKDLTLSIGENIYLAGNFRVRDITDPTQTLLNLDLDHLESDVATVQQLIPTFNPPKEFENLGHFTFSGQFDGFYKDFVAYGEIKTDIGSADLDMHLDTEKGRAGAEYSGKLNLTDFDLGIWTGNDELGKISGKAQIKNGFSLLAQSAKANLNAEISSFKFRNYLYKDVRFNGLIEAGQLDGTLKMDDENLDFDFSGSLVFGQQDPHYNFKANIDHVDLNKLFLSDRPMVLSGNIDMDASDLNLNTIEGDVFMQDMTLLMDDTLNFYFDSLELHAYNYSADAKKIELKSDIVDLDIDGDFLLDKVHLSFLKMLQDNYPVFYDRFNLPKQDFIDLGSQDFVFDLDVKDSQNLFTVIKNSPIDTIRDLKLAGSYNTTENYFSLTGYTPNAYVANIALHGLSLDAEQSGGVLLSSISTDSIFISDQVRIRALKLDNDLAQDTLQFRLSTTELSDVLKNVNIGGDLFLADENFGMKFNSSELIVFDEKWEISKNNQILFNQDFIRTSDLFASNGQQFLYVNSIKDKGIEIGAEYFDLDILNSIWVYDKLNFNGEFELFIRTEDVFNLTDFQSDLHLDSLFINGDHYGEFMLDTKMNGVKMPIRAALNIVDEDKYLTAVGRVTPKGFGRPANKQTDVDMEVYLEDYPAEIIEYWIGEGAENTSGIVDAELKLQGPIDRIDMSGVGHLQDVQTKVIFLGTTYKIEDMDVEVTNNLIDVTGGVMVDRYGNRATAVGGITHDKMTNLGLDIELKSDRFLALNTDKYSGESFYGHAIGEMQVNFSGQIDAPDIDVVGVTGDSTEIFIPLEQANGLTESDFVIFDHDTVAVNLADIKDRFKVSGVNFSMDLEINDKAKMKVIMDELEENIMSGTGNGNLSIFMNRSGDFNIFGSYIIDQGDYIYSFENTLRRNFEIAQGGRINWTGDPFNATIDITAEYETNTPLAPFIEEYLSVDDPNSNDAQKNQRVKVILDIDGLLLQPQLTFDLAFLNLPSGPLAGFVNTKMNTIQADQNLLNRQVLWLLAFGSFPTDQSDLGSAVTSSENLTNTVSEFISYQLSKFISEILYDAVTDASFISDFGLTIDYRQNTTVESGANDVFLVNPEFEFFDGKLNLSGGASYVRSTVNGVYVANDVILEFSLNKNKRLKAKLYQISDIEVGNRKIEIGAGISYQRDFDRFIFQKKYKQLEVKNKNSSIIIDDN